MSYFQCNSTTSSHKVKRLLRLAFGFPRCLRYHFHFSLGGTPLWNFCPPVPNGSSLSLDRLQTVCPGTSHDYLLELPFENALHPEFHVFYFPRLFSYFGRVYTHSFLRKGQVYKNIWNVLCFIMSLLNTLFWARV